MLRQDSADVGRAPLMDAEARLVLALEQPEEGAVESPLDEEDALGMGTGGLVAALGIKQVLAKRDAGPEAVGPEMAAVLVAILAAYLYFTG